MSYKQILLIADRNPHIRNFLQREMAAAGYEIRLASNGREVLEWCYSPELLDLLILDPDLPDLDEALLCARLDNRIPRLPVVIHACLENNAALAAIPNVVAVVEKRGRSILALKKIINQTLDTLRP